MMKICVFLVVLICGCRSINIYFKRYTTCVKERETGCDSWNSTTQLMLDLDFYYYMCFPQGTMVQTEDGQKPIEEIKKGDRILAYNPQTGNPQFSNIISWLHRDTESLVDFTEITTTDDLKYIASSGHHIGFNDEGKVGFKYADEFNNGDELIVLSRSSHPQVVKELNQVSGKGMYAPYTELSNFYIYPAMGDWNGNQDDEEGEGSPMILVHCLSQIDNPLKQQHWIHTMMHGMSWLGLSKHENEEHEEYLHPITHLMGWIGIRHRSARMQLPNHEQNLNHDRYSSHISNSNNNREQQKRRMMSWFTLFQNTMNEVCYL